MPHVPYRRLVRLDDDTFEVPVAAGSGSVRVSAAASLFSGVTYAPGSVVFLTAVEQFAGGDLLEWPYGSANYYRVESSVPLPPFSVQHETMAVRTDTVPKIAYRVLIADVNVTVGGAGVLY